MAKNQEPVFCDSSVSSCGDIELGEETMGVMEQDGLFKKRGDVYVVDVESLVHVVDKDLNGLKLQRTLSRKGSQRVEWKSTAERDARDAAAGTHVGVCTVEKSCGVPLLATASPESKVPATTATAENRGRRFLRSSSSVNTRRSCWLDPRKVLVTFATVSSMGTMILIYFTLSAANINAGDVHI